MSSKPQAFYLHNQSSSELHRADLESLPSLAAKHSFTDKEQFRKWCQSADTRHVFYTLYEPAHPAMRSSASNPVQLMHGVVADYDGVPSAVQAAVATMKCGAEKAPTWVTTTFSGKARLIWAFERPVPVFNSDVFQRFRAILAKDLKLKSLLPGFDEGAWDNPHTPFEIGTAWRRPFGDTRLDHGFVLTAIHDASNRAKFKTDGPTIPMEIIGEEITRRFPGRWKSAFIEGARGVRFWDEKADNPNGATMRDTGVQAWTGECRFLPWSEILGSDFVKKYRENRIGAAIEGIHFDGMYYWQRDAGGIFRTHTTDSIKRHLNTDFGLSYEGKKGGPSEVAAALSTIDLTKQVDGAFPCLYMKTTVVRDQNSNFLNISRVAPMPIEGRGNKWAEGFPWMANYMEGMFGEEQLPVFLSWLGHFYNNARIGKPRKGHALFIAGDVSSGKTFLSQRIVGSLMGGFCDASSYLLGHTSFNEQLFHAPVWAIDDAVASTEMKRHAQYTQMVKKFVANPYQEFHPKFKKAISFRYHGRLIVTMNDDEESINMLPSIDRSILDKIVVLRAGKPGTSFAEADENAHAELPHFAEFLATWKTPEKLLTKHDEVHRFGHNAWHNESLMETARNSSPSAGLMELLDLWRPLYFRQSKTEEWVGTATDLLGQLKQTETISGLIGGMSRNSLGMQLQGLARQGVKWVQYCRGSQGRQYRIARPADMPIYS